jgi:uncharacterized protein YuzE
MTTYPNVKIDLQHRMLAVRLTDGQIAWTDQLDDAHLVDVDAEGRVVALDIMTLDDFKIDEMAARFGFAEQVPAIKSAIQKVMTPTTAGSFGEPILIPGTKVSDVSADVETEDSAPPAVVPTIIS